jgi:hypothetical protein
MRETATAEVRLDEGKNLFQRREAGKPDDLASNRGGCDQILLRRASMRPKIMPNRPAIWGMSVETLPVARGAGGRPWMSA